MFDAQSNRFGFRLGCRRGVGGKFRDEVGEIKCATFVHLHADEWFGRADFLEHPRVAEERRQLKIHINFVPRNERLTVFVLDEQTANGRRERERIYFYCVNRNFAVELRGQLFYCDVPDNRRQN